MSSQCERLAPVCDAVYKCESIPYCSSDFFRDFQLESMNGLWKTFSYYKPVPPPQFATSSTLTRGITKRKCYIYHNNIVADYQGGISKTTLRLLFHPWFSKGDLADEWLRALVFRSVHIPAPNSHIHNQLRAHMPTEYWAFIPSVII